ncbi:ABC transporter ATP-binding protein [Trueperella bialowiezensis]|uniref:ABC transporter ATP-binding protein n=1 Tax=Trueperella bialowiezensis TaxID=312285 RepID=UPI003899C6AD
MSASVDAGDIHAIIGPNGAGKTTLVKMAATILNPSSGNVVVNGFDTVKSPSAARGSLGLVIGGELGFYPRATARQNLRFFADLAGVARSRLTSEIDRVLELVALADRADDKVNTFSRGMVQRLHIARALLGEPNLLIMDEPTSGLDPDIAMTVRAIIKDLANAGHAVLLTSHTMSEIEDLSSQISVLGAGRIFMSGNVGEIKERAGISVTSVGTLRVSDAHVIDTLADLPEIKDVKKSPKGANWAVTLLWKAPITPAQAHEAATRVFANSHVAVPVDFVSRLPTLEEAYVSMANELRRS